MGQPEFKFLDPLYLWFLVLPAALMLIWFWRLASRAADVGRYRRDRVVPIEEKLSVFRPLVFWLCLILASVLTILALARPQSLLTTVRTGTVDLVIVQDGSASIRTEDVYPNRWQRSMAWIKRATELLSWKGDRVALLLFAHQASPQVRFSKDPNILLFFLDHLNSQPPFPLESATTWDTNIEEGIYWGVKMVKKDRELNGRNKNPQAFVVISDGVAWSGKVENALAQANKLGIPVYVIGVGTVVGGVIPRSAEFSDDKKPILAKLDRSSLQSIALRGRGKYFELDSEPDDRIVGRIIKEVQDRSGSVEKSVEFEDLYWWFLLSAAGFMGLGFLSLKERSELRHSFVALIFVSLVLLFLVK